MVQLLQMRVLIRLGGGFDTQKCQLAQVSSGSWVGNCSSNKAYD